MTTLLEKARARRIDALNSLSNRKIRAAALPGELGNARPVPFQPETAKRGDYQAPPAAAAIPVFMTSRAATQPPLVLH